jgi:hypothetical protein
MRAIEPFGRNNANFLKPFTEGTFFDKASKLTRVERFISLDW